MSSSIRCAAAFGVLSGLYTPVIRAETNCPRGSKIIRAEKSTPGEWQSGFHGCQLGNGTRGKWGRWNQYGAPLEKGRFWQGKKDGRWTYWYSSPAAQQAVTREVQVYRRGERRGKWSAWYNDGQLKSEARYVLGKPSGTWRNWRTDGTLSQETIYEEGVQTEIRYFDERGEIARSEKTVDGNKQVVRFAWGQALPDGPAPVVCSNSRKQEIPAAGISSIASLGWGGFAGRKFVLVRGVAAKSGRPAGAQAHVFDPEKGRWSVVPPTEQSSAEPRTLQNSVYGRALDGERLAFSKPGNWRLDVAGLRWRAAPQPPEGTQLIEPSGSCEFAFGPSGSAGGEVRGYVWCTGEPGWSELPSLPSDSVPVQWAFGRDGDIAGLLPEKADSAAARSGRLVAWRRGQGEWGVSELPIQLGQMTLMSQPHHGRVLLLGGQGTAEMVGASYTWENATLSPTSSAGAPDGKRVRRMRSAGSLAFMESKHPRYALFDAVAVRWGEVPSNLRALSSAGVWSHGGLGELPVVLAHLHSPATSLMAPSPRLPVYSWDTRRWCFADADGPILLVDRERHRRRPATRGKRDNGDKGRIPAGKSNYAVFISRNAFVFWGHRHTTVVPCNRRGMPCKDDVRSTFEDGGVYVTW